MNPCVCLSACMSVFGKDMCVCATKQDRTETDPEKQIFKMCGQALLPNCLHPVLNFPQTAHETGISRQIVMEPLYQGYTQLPTLPGIQVIF